MILFADRYKATAMHYVCVHLLDYMVTHFLQMVIHESVLLSSGEISQTLLDTNRGEWGKEKKNKYMDYICRTNNSAYNV